MDPETKHLLTELLMVEKQNHRILRAVHRHQLFGSFWKLIVWLLVLAACAYAYFSYLGPLMKKYGVQNSSSSGGLLNSLPSSAELQKLINSYKAAQ